MIKKMLCIFIFILFSCATTIDVVITKPAKLSKSIGQNILIFDKSDFQKGNYSLKEVLKEPINSLFGSGEREKAFYFVKKMFISDLSKELNSAGFYIFYDKPTDQHNIDSIMILNLAELDFKDNYYYEKLPTTDLKKNRYTEIDVQFIKREVKYRLAFSILDLHGNELLSKQIFEVEEDVQREDRSYRLKSNHDLLLNCVKRSIDEILIQVAPYEINEKRTLVTSKNDYVLKRADILVNCGLYSDALYIYKSMWHKKNSITAAYNAAILSEVIGDLKTAEFLLRSIALKTGSRKYLLEYKRVLDRLNKNSKD